MTVLGFIIGVIASWCGLAFTEWWKDKRRLDILVIKCTFSAEGNRSNFCFKVEPKEKANGLLLEVLSFTVLGDSNKAYFLKKKVKLPTEINEGKISILSKYFHHNLPDVEKSAFDQTSEYSVESAELTVRASKYCSRKIKAQFPDDLLKGVSLPYPWSDTHNTL